MNSRIRISGDSTISPRQIGELPSSLLLREVLVDHLGLIGNSQEKVGLSLPSPHTPCTSPSFPLHSEPVLLSDPRDKTKGCFKMGCNEVVRAVFKLGVSASPARPLCLQKHYLGYPEGPNVSTRPSTGHQTAVLLSSASGLFDTRCRAFAGNTFRSQQDLGTEPCSSSQIPNSSTSSSVSSEPLLAGQSASLRPPREALAGDKPAP